MRKIEVSFLDVASDFGSLEDKDVVIGRGIGTPIFYAHYKDNRGRQIFVSSFPRMDNLIERYELTDVEQDVVQNGAVDFENGSFDSEIIEPDDERHPRDLKALEDTKLWHK